jgi:hypothetical protein
MTRRDRLRWYQARLRTMSVAELLFRTRRAVSGLIDMWRERYPRPYAWYLTGPCGARLVPPAAWWAVPALKARLGIRPAGEAGTVLDACCPDAVRATVAAAQAMSEGRLCFFDETWQYGPEWQWRRDPRGQDVWPLRHWTRVAIRQGGAKYVWEPSRHQQLITLGKAWYWTGDPMYSTALEHAFASWLRQNPPKYGVHWASGIELAIRLVSWSWALGFAGAALELTDTTKGQVLAGIALQAAHLNSHLSEYSSANNHRIAEAAGLAMTGMLFPEFADAAAWKATGMAILSSELELQVSSDGVGREQAVHYHGEVLEWYLLVVAVDRRSGGAACQAWGDRLRKMAGFLELVTDEGNNVPEFGDSDDARIVRLCEAPTNYYQSLRTMAALLLDDGSVLRGDEPADETAFWLSDACDREKYPVSTPAGRHIAVFPQDGWVIHRSPAAGSAGVRAHLAFNCGALGYGTLAAHGHADALSIWLSVAGVPLLIDPGTGTYHEDARVRRYFRSTAAHTTMEVDGQDQSVQMGATIWHSHARVALCFGDRPAHRIAQGRHLGYHRLADPVTHVRTILWYEPCVYAVVDTLLGMARHSLGQFWHTLPGTQVTLEGERACLIAREGAAIRLWTWSSVPTAVALVEGSTDPMLGWYSPAYGKHLASPTLHRSCDAELPVSVVTIIDCALASPILAMTVHPGTQTLCLRRASGEALYDLSPLLAWPAGSN